jgi:hypothetical protein
MTNIALAKGDKCISAQNDGGTGTACTTEKQDERLSGEAKKECRESGAKCSSSQTGFTFPFFSIRFSHPFFSPTEFQQLI